MILHGKVYDVLKAIALVWLPAFGVLYAALALAWHFPAVEAVTGSVLAVDTFLGGILGISSSAYNKSDVKYDGEFKVEPTDDGGQKLLLTSVSYDALNTKNELTFKLNDDSLQGPSQ